MEATAIAIKTPHKIGKHFQSVNEALLTKVIFINEVSAEFIGNRM